MIDVPFKIFFSPETSTSSRLEHYSDSSNISNQSARYRTMDEVVGSSQDTCLSSFRRSIPLRFAF